MVDKKKILIVEGNTREENSEFTNVGINTHTESLIESINFYKKALDLIKKSRNIQINLGENVLETKIKKD